MKRFLALTVLCSLFAGCTSITSINLTNLTPRQQPRNPNGLYPVEVAWDSNQQNIVHDSIKGYVVVGEEAYPMQRQPVLTNRWETFLPVPADKTTVNYLFKFDYLYKDIPIRKPGSRRSAPAQLEILDR